MNYEKKRNFIVNVLYIVVLALVILFFFKYVAVWILPFLIGFIIAFLLKPATRWLSKITHIKHKGMALFVIALFYAFIAVILWLLAAFIIGQIGGLIHQLPDLYEQKISPLLEQLNLWLTNSIQQLSPETADSLGQGLKSALNSFASMLSNFSASVVIGVTSMASRLPLYLITLIFSVVCSVFISMDYQNITSFLKKQIPSKVMDTINDTLAFIKGSLFKMIKAYALIMLITFGELIIGFLLLRVEYALPLAALIAVLDILPFIGTGGVLIPWALFEFLMSNFSLGIGLLILYAVITVLRNIIEPRIVGIQIGLHPVLTITAMYAGLRMFGFLGFICAPMVVLILKFLNDSGRIHLYKT